MRALLSAALVALAFGTLASAASAQEVGPKIAKLPAWPKTVDAAAACHKQVQTLNADLQKDMMAMAQRQPNMAMGAPNTTSPAYAQATQRINEAMECRPALGSWLPTAVPDARGALEPKLRPIDAEREKALEKCVVKHGEGGQLDEKCKKAVDAQYNGRARAIAETWLPEPGKQYASAYQRVQACVAKGDTARTEGAKAGLSGPFLMAVDPGMDLSFYSGLMQFLGEHCSAAAATARRYHD
jgi:hypothetical protein